MRWFIFAGCTGDAQTALDADGGVFGEWNYPY
jgi:hypothetical protein